MQIIIDCHHYDYFGGASKHDYTKYENLLEGWRAYKRKASYDYDYGDSWQHTRYFVDHDYAVTPKRNRPHARSEYEWNRLKEFMRDYECTGMKASYVESHKFEIMVAYDRTHTNPFDLFDDEDIII